MFCEHCGKPVKDTATFCPACGELVKSVKKPVYAPLPGQEAPPVNPPVQQSAPVQNNFNDPNMQYQNVPPNGYNYGAPGAVTPPPPVNDNSWASISSLVLGIFSVLSCGTATLFIILSIAFGIVGLKSPKRGLSIAGIVLSVLSVAIIVLLFIAIIIGLMPSEFYYVFNGISSI